jgi:hypothetical protein
MINLLSRRQIPALACKTRSAPFFKDGSPTTLQPGHLARSGSRNFQAKATERRGKEPRRADSYLKARSQHKRKLTILCYPQVPRSIYVLYKLAHFAGWRITDNPKARHDLVIRFEDTTYASIDDVLSGLAERTDVLNARCTDISKRRVDSISTPIFGRSLMIDPLTYSGECLMIQAAWRRNGKTILPVGSSTQNRRITFLQCDGTGGLR